MNSSSIIHSKRVSNKAVVGPFSVVHEDVTVDAGATIESHVTIERGSLIQAKAVLRAGVFVGQGVRVEESVVIEPNATIFPGVIVSQGAKVGAGAVVTKNVPANAIVVGVPAKIVGYVANSKTPAVAVTSTHESGNPQTNAPHHLGVGESFIVHMPFIKDLRGNLTVGEFERNVPFQPKRYFLVVGVPASKVRGEHAHHKCKQFLICVAGSCTVLVDDGVHRVEVTLDQPNKGLYIPPMVWGVQHKYSRDAVLLVFASDFYDADDYIREYSEFRQLTERK